MQTVTTVDLSDSREERLPGWEADFPHISTRAELDRYTVPWHWHRSVEVFYLESGCLEYHTSTRTVVFPAGSGGFVNSNVLHRSCPLPCGEATVQTLHLFDPVLVGGEQGSRIFLKYVAPILDAPGLEIIPLFPDDPAHTGALELLKESFRLSLEETGYELKLRAALSGLWLHFFALSADALSRSASRDEADEKVKQMMAFVQAHLSEKITLPQLAAAGFVSQRECFRIFRARLHTTPLEYIRSCRLQLACRLLAQERCSLTEVGAACGLGSSSYFGKTFREHMGCTPLEYRRKWQDRDI